MSEPVEKHTSANKFQIERAKLYDYPQIQGYLLTKKHIRLKAPLLNISPPLACIEIN